MQLLRAVMMVQTYMGEYNSTTWMTSLNSWKRGSDKLRQVWKGVNWSKIWKGFALPNEQVYSLIELWVLRIHFQEKSYFLALSTWYKTFSVFEFHEVAGCLRLFNSKNDLGVEVSHLSLTYLIPFFFLTFKQGFSMGRCLVHRLISLFSLKPCQ